MTMSKLSASAVGTLVEWAGNLPAIGSSSQFILELNPVNGVASDVAQTATAYPWRAPDAVTLKVMLRWPRSHEEDSTTWTAWKWRFLAAMQAASGTINSYANYENKDMPGQDYSEAYFGPNKYRVASTWLAYRGLHRPDPPWMTEPVISELDS